jgi:hypothetical protein
MLAAEEHTCSCEVCRFAHAETLTDVRTYTYLARRCYLHAKRQPAEKNGPGRRSRRLSECGR